jgi:hypothetical protein
MTPEIINALTPVVEAFEQLSVAYCVGGSVASSHYGLNRETNDIDLIADVRPEHINPLVEQLEDEYYIDSYMIQNAIQHKSSFNVIHFGTGIKVDVFILKDTPFVRGQLQHIKQRSLREGSRMFSLASPEDTLLAKLNWFRMGGEISSRQWNDILGLIQKQRANLDLEYLRQTAPQLGVTDLLEKALSEADTTPQP